MSLQKERKDDEHTNNPERPRRGVKNDRVYRILLCDVEGTLTRYRIAKLAQAQQIQVNLLLRKLEKLNLVTGSRVIDHKGLLTRWSRLKIKYESQSYMLPNVMETLKKARMEYGLTTYRAESMVNGYLFPSKTEFYIRPDDFDDWHALLVKEGPSWEEGT